MELSMALGIPAKAIVSRAMKTSYEYDSPPTRRAMSKAFGFLITNVRIDEMRFSLLTTTLYILSFASIPISLSPTRRDNPTTAKSFRSFDSSTLPTTRFSL